MALSAEEVLKQSQAAFKQWGSTWKEHAVKNGKLYQELKTSHKDLLFTGMGKTLLCIAYAPSFEEQIDIVKQYKNDAVDIACVEKCLGSLLDHGITPKYVFTADAGVSYEKWMKPWKEKTKDINLIMNITGNPEWCYNWELNEKRNNIYFYVNKDNIQTEKIYQPLSGCNEVIPASSNVGNTVLVFSTQVFGYDKYLTLGYDFCWSADTKYYAFTDSDKRWWMRHMNTIDKKGNFIYTSQNLVFSARWASDYYKNVLWPKKIKMFDCSDRGIFELPTANLKRELKQAKKRELTNEEKSKIFQSKIQSIVLEAKDGPEKLNEVMNSVNVAQVIVNHIPQEVLEWLN